MNELEFVGRSIVQISIRWIPIKRREAGAEKRLLLQFRTSIINQSRAYQYIPSTAYVSKLCAYVCTKENNYTLVSLVFHIYYILD